MMKQQHLCGSRATFHIDVDFDQELRVLLCKLSDRGAGGYAVLEVDGHALFCESTVDGMVGSVKSLLRSLCSRSKLETLR